MSRSTKSASDSYLAVSKNQGPPFGSSYKKDHSVLGSVFGPPMFGNSYFMRPNISKKPPILLKRATPFTSWKSKCNGFQVETRRP